MLFSSLILVMWPWSIQILWQSGIRTVAVSNNDYAWRQLSNSVEYSNYCNVCAIQHYTLDGGHAY